MTTSFFSRAFLRSFLFLIVTILSSCIAFAEGDASTQGTNGTTTIFTTEVVPGADCICAVDNRDSKDINWGATLESQCWPITTRKYKCTLPTGLSGFQTVFAKIIRYVINIVLLLGVLAIVGLGIAWSFAGGDDVKAKSTLKTWAINIVMGLIILFMFRYILLFLAPWVYN